jgi:hypothetical protein
MGARYTDTEARRTFRRLRQTFAERQAPAGIATLPDDAWVSRFRGGEGEVLLDRHTGRRAVKTYPVTVDPDTSSFEPNLARLDMLLRVNTRACELGVGPRNVRAYVAVSGGRLCCCVEYDFVTGIHYDKLTLAARARAAPLVAAQVRRLAAAGLVCRDVHPGNVICSPDGSQATLIDFGYDCIDATFTGALEQGMRRKLLL